MFAAANEPVLGAALLAMWGVESREGYPDGGQRRKEWQCLSTPSQLLPRYELFMRAKDILLNGLPNTRITEI